MALKVIHMYGMFANFYVRTIYVRYVIWLKVMVTASSL